MSQSYYSHEDLFLLCYHHYADDLSLTDWTKAHPEIQYLYAKYLIYKDDENLWDQAATLCILAGRNAHTDSVLTIEYLIHPKTVDEFFDEPELDQIEFLKSKWSEAKRNDTNFFHDE